ncbi:MAG: hypothetical protein CVV44_15615 [Spirochaetae bacterium HGW-Spirochaetae-1]|jgi:3-oxoacyl-[acyl-carrier protein] reductase|nr:MAG: hypothetical protein CVV44_15615 [Spirochaetae bacterium HGW-Spirochaetae-1]
MDLHLKDKRALVCGASKGLGYAVARSLLEEGVRVVIAARTGDVLDKAADSLKEETGVRPFPVAADLTRSEDRERLVELAQKELGGVDILVANAGGPPTGTFESFGQKHWQLAIELALGSVTHLTALLLPAMKEQRFGRITQIVSIAGLEVLDGLILSHASRPAVLGFAKALAREVAPFNVLVNSICPGIFLTDRIRDIARQQADQRGITGDQFLKEFSGDIPVGRPGDPRELGDLAAFLSSPRNTYITGAAVTIDGGKTRRLY